MALCVYPIFAGFALQLAHKTIKHDDDFSRKPLIPSLDGDSFFKFTSNALVFFKTGLKIYFLYMNNIRSFFMQKYGYAFT